MDRLTMEQHKIFARTFDRMDRDAKEAEQKVRKPR